ncbi:MAG: DUF58 domain-containing protein [Akkermansiaceae bacterium]|jgi:uncharacterized protein (DUF58 family)|nr:DUF58 domain-containing protein [Akkermansiaceae bacterium]
MMELPALQLAHTTAMAAAGRLRLPLRSKSWQGQAGEFAGSGTGSSLDFQDHRAYAPGDDPRHINWQAYARTGSYTMKLFREEVRPVVDLVFDVSESMFFDEAKARRSAEVFYFLTESCSSAGASFHVHLVRGDKVLPLDPMSVRNHRWMDIVKDMRGEDPGAPPDVSKVPVRANSIRVLLSDLLFPGDPEPVLRHLGQRHGSIVMFSPWLESEARPDWSGNYEFIDAERGSRHPHRIEAATLRRYLESYANHFSVWKTAARRHQAALARIPAEEDLTSALYREALPAKALEPV